MCPLFLLVWDNVGVVNVMSELTEKLRKLAEEVAKELGYEIYNLTFGRGKRRAVLTVVIDKEDGYISISDCEIFSHTFGKKLDEADIINSSYNLVIESPGAERELRKPKDFIRFIGKSVKIILKEPMENRSVLVGQLLDANENSVVVVENDSKREFKVEYQTIKKANLRFEQ